MVKTIVIDPGHGGTDPGASGNGIKEKDIVLEIGKKVKYYLESQYQDVKVILTRETDKYIELSQRCKISNSLTTSLFVSIHINAANSTSAHGFETFIYNKTSSATTKAYQKKLHEAIMKGAPYFTDRGTNSANFQVLRGTTAPAILTESGFITNAQDSSILKTKEKLDNIAKAHVDGIAICLGLKKKPIANTKSYKVQVGAYDDKQQAEAIKNSIEKLGYKSVSIVYE
jgi:N-acetylmuramoyl-L-alanine amidase